MAHRVAYELFVGPIPSGKSIDHECHNGNPDCEAGDRCPHRACVNPDHLKPKSLKANIRASPHCGAAKNARKIDCKNGHPLKGRNVVTIAGKRVCRKCRRAKDRAYKQREDRRAKQAAYAKGENRKASMHAYNERTKEEKRAYQRAYYLRNRERILARVKAQRDVAATG
jgi:hypothetical protein